MGCVIAGCGKALPQLAITNDDLSRIVDTTDEWISTRSGIHQRRIAVEETTTDLGAQAAERALAAAGFAPDTVDLLVCMTITPDATIPCQASLIRARLGLSSAAAFDLNAACTGCVYGLVVADSMMTAAALSARPAHAGHTDASPATTEDASPATAGTAAPTATSARNPIRRALVIGVERLSRLMNWEDRSTCVLFGDGAGAVALEWREDRPGIMSSFIKNTDDETLSLFCGNAINAHPLPQLFLDKAAANAPEPFDYADAYLSMDGQKVFKFATAALTEAVCEACDRAGIALDQVSLIVPHQANERIIRYAAKKLGLDLDKFQISIGQTGNTSAASALMALTDAYQAGRISPGDYVIVCGFGGGLTSGAVAFQA